MDTEKKMFAITQKPQELVNAEDLEILQNELERCLVNVVSQKWELERDSLSLTCTSPDFISSCQGNSCPTSTSVSLVSSNALGGKLKSSSRTHSGENHDRSPKESGAFVGVSNNGVSESISAANSNDDSVSSEGSLVSSMTSSTIITNALSELSSQPPTSNLTVQNVKTKRLHRGSNDRPSKRFRQNSSNSLTSSNSGYSKRPSLSKHRSKIVPSKLRQSNEKCRSDKKQLPRNSAPDKLWPFVEQFCAAPTDDQIRDLEEMIKVIDQDKEYYKIPALGKKEALNKETSAKVDPSPGKNHKKSKIRSTEEEPSLGALTQRLVSSFIAESDDVSQEVASCPDIQQSKKKNTNKFKSGKDIDIDSAKSLEHRIRQKLEEYDILDHRDEIPYTSEEDEILRELVASQHELLAIQRHNKESMQRLLKKAKRHVEIEAERKNLREANADVISAYHKLIVAKQRKRNPTKKEKDAAWKALKVQEAIFKRCDDLYLSSIGKDEV